MLRRGSRSVTYGFRINRTGELLARGEMTAVCFSVDAVTGSLESMVIPAEIGARIGVGENERGESD